MLLRKIAGKNQPRQLQISTLSCATIIIAFKNLDWASALTIKLFKIIKEQIGFVMYISIFMIEIFQRQRIVRMREDACKKRMHHLTHYFCSCMVAGIVLLRPSVRK